MSSFRSRLRRSTLVVFALLFVAFSAALYVSLSTVLYRHADDSLLTLAQAEATHINDEAGSFQDLADRETDENEHDEAIEGDEDLRAEYERHELQEAIRASVIVDPGGTILWRGEAAGIMPHVPKHLWTRIVNGETVFDTVRTSHSPPFRRVSLPVLVDGTVRYILQTHTSLQFVEDALRGLLMTLGGLVAVILLLAWLGSTWIAREALIPVNSLSRTAATVSERNLRTRVLLDAPYAEFQQLAQSFNGMLERLQTVFESQRRFVADAAHELKTPLTAIKGNLEVTLQRARSVDEYRDTLTTTLGEVERLITLVRSLLTLAQYAGERPIFRQTLNLRHLLQALVADFAVLAEEKGCRLTAELQEDVPFVKGDAGQLKQLVINLLDNAIQHTPREGSVVIRLHSNEQHVVIQIEDTGSGIDSEHLPHLFDRFYRVDKSRARSSGGTGLGLAIAKEITEAHGGTIGVQSVVGRGTIFTVNLPVADHTADAATSCESDRTRQELRPHRPRD